MAHVRGSGDDGTDTITNVERLRFTDQTVDLTDTTAPTVTDRTPAANATNVATNSNITATFSEPVTGVNANTFRVTNSAGTAVSAVVTYNAATRTATLNPNANLLDDRTYTVQLTNGIRDTSGNTLAPTTWNFTTTGPAPSVTGRTPAANATNVAINSNITATFSEPVTGVNANTFRVTNSAGTAVSAVVTYNAATRTATLNPNANLLADRTYTVQLTNGIRDLQGNALPATTWNFTTAGAAPSVTGRTPAANARNVATNSNITATFSEPVTGVNANTFRVTNSAGTAVSAVVTYNAATRTATLNPNANLLDDRTYTVQLTNGIRDLQGNALPATTWTFTTAGPAPSVTGRTPAANARNVATNSNITATFSEPVTGVNANTFRVTNSAGTAVTAVVTYNSTTRTATLNPNANLLTDRTYTVQLTSGIRDLQGQALPATTWNFTTQAGPGIAGRTPAVNGTNVATNRDLAVTFSEPVRGVSASTVTLKTSAGKLVPATVKYDAAKRTATVKPKAILASSTRFTVSLTNGITDVNGNRLAASSWSFKTESRPTVSKRTHAAGAKSINRSSNVSVKFSEAVSGVSRSSFKLVDSKGKTVSAKVSYNSRTKTATLNPSSKLKANATYKIRLSSSIKDASGNRLSATNWSFRTGR